MYICEYRCTNAHVNMYFTQISIHIYISVPILYDIFGDSLLVRGTDDDEDSSLYSLQLNTDSSILSNLFIYSYIYMYTYITNALLSFYYKHMHMCMYI
jgi:hypothetical protein